ncbi:MAG: DUF4321 domain-containing protein [Clostridiales bacterium]|jgi:hypothetical protein|nr:DUF4321 domain-containing protein [Clostridiales bacterium]
MYSGKNLKNPWNLFLLLLAGLTLGAFVGEYAADLPFLKALAYGTNFGFTEPVALDLHVIKLQFALLVRLNLGGVIGSAIAIIVYKRT